MKRLALAASLLVAAGCTPPDTDVAVSGEPERVVVRAQSFDLGGVWATPATAPGATTTTTSTVPPTTTTPPAPPVTAAASPPVGSCGGWEGLVAAYFPADQVATGCRILMCESGGNPNAVSPTNDHGLWQINAVHARSFDWSRRYDPHVNTAYARDLWGRQGWTPWSCY